VVGLDAATGEVVWQAEVDGRVKSAPVVVPGGVLFFREPSEVVLFRSSDNVANQTQN
jgi:outer membrane protein assembly factor BamB